MSRQQWGGGGGVKMCRQQLGCGGGENASTTINPHFTSASKTNKQNCRCVGFPMKGRDFLNKCYSPKKKKAQLLLRSQRRENDFALRPVFDSMPKCCHCNERYQAVLSLRHCWF